MTLTKYKKLMSELGVDRGQLKDGVRFRPDLESVCNPGKANPYDYSVSSAKARAPELAEDLSHLNPVIKGRKLSMDRKKDQIT